MTGNNEITRLVCPACASPRVVVEAEAEWNAAENRLVVVNQHNDMPCHCESCGQEFLLWEGMVETCPMSCD